MDKTKNSQQKNWHSAFGVSAGVFLAALSLLSVNVALAQYGGSSSGGGSTGDRTAPIISNIAVTAVSTSTATITWTTNEASISWVVYGTTTAYGLEVKTTSYITSHSLTLPNLNSLTTYHYSVKSKDAYGNIGSYADKTFTTLATGNEVIGMGGGVTIPTLEKPFSEMTLPELQAKINQFLAVIRQLQDKLAIARGVSGPMGCTIASFVRNLKQGDSGDDVKCLQIILNSSADTQVATTGVGSPGHETTYFGFFTKGAVIKFQNKYVAEILAPLGLTNGTGTVGGKTRMKLNGFLSR